MISTDIVCKCEDHGEISYIIENMDHKYYSLVYHYRGEPCKSSVMTLCDADAIYTNIFIQERKK